MLDRKRPFCQTLRLWNPAPSSRLRPRQSQSSAIFHSLGHGPTCVKRSRFHDCADFVARQEARAARPSSESSLMESKRPSVSSAMAGRARSWLADSSRRSTYSRLAPPPVSRRTSSDAPSTASARSPRETASRKMVNGAGACTLIHASIEIIQRLHKECLFPKDCTKQVEPPSAAPSRPVNSWFGRIWFLPVFCLYTAIRRRGSVAVNHVGAFCPTR